MKSAIKRKAINYEVMQGKTIKRADKAHLVTKF